MILVSHSDDRDSGALRPASSCSRADALERIGDPDACARRYSELAIAGTPSRDEQPVDDVYYPVEIADLWIGDPARGHVPDRPDPRNRFGLHAVIETKEEIENASFRLEIRNQNRARIFSPPGTGLNGGERIPAGERLHIEATIENRLTPDVYCLEWRGQPPRRGATTTKRLSDAKSIDFAIPGDRYRGQGLLSLESSGAHSKTWARPDSAPQEEQRGS